MLRLARSGFVIHSPLQIEVARKGLRRELATLSGHLLGEFDGKHLFAVVDLAIAPLVEIEAKLEEWPTKRRATLRGEIRASYLGVVLLGVLALVPTLVVLGMAITNPFVGIAVPLVFFATLSMVRNIWRDNATRAREVLERTMHAAQTTPRARRLIQTRPISKQVADESLAVPVPIEQLSDPYRGRVSSRGEHRPRVERKLPRSRAAWLGLVWRRLRLAFRPRVGEHD